MLPDIFMVFPLIFLVLAGRPPCSQIPVTELADPDADPELVTVIVLFVTVFEPPVVIVVDS